MAKKNLTSQNNKSQTTQPQNQNSNVHEQRETLTIDIFIPNHEIRKESPVFNHTRDILLKATPTCFICGRTGEQAGQPLEAHHSYIEWSYANAVDWAIVKDLCNKGEWGFTQRQRDEAKNFDWSKFEEANPYSFVDNMLVNGLILCKDHHTGKDEGIHMMDHPRWISQRFLKQGFDFSPTEVINHN